MALPGRLRRPRSFSQHLPAADLLTRFNNQNLWGWRYGGLPGRPDTARNALWPGVAGGSIDMCPPAGDKADAGCGRQTEQPEYPRRGDLFDGSGSRGQRMEGGALIPRRDQPVRRQRSLQGAADAQPGRVPPMTKPKWRGPALATRPGSAPATSASMTAVGSSPRSGTDPPSTLRTPAASTRASTGRSWRVFRNTCACCAARFEAGGAIGHGDNPRAR